MGKNYKLKKSYIQESMNLYGIRFILFLFKWKFKRNESKEKVLVKASDGIGDLLIRSRLSSRIIEKYGKENVYFLMKDNYLEVGNILGYNSIGYSRKERKNFFSRLKKMYLLNQMQFTKYINLEFINEITVGNLFIKERIGLIDNNQLVKRNNKYYTKSFNKPKEKYILYMVKKMWEEILGEKVSLEEVKPDLRDLFGEEKSGIVIQMGSSARNKICSPIRMAKYIEKIKEITPKKEITLVGYGELQFQYAKKIEELLPKIKFKNLVNKTNLKGVFNEVAKAELYFGFDSGLYNLAYCLRKPIIALFGSDEQKGFIHSGEQIKILSAAIFEAEENKISDEIYCNDSMNNISVEKVIKAYNEIVYV